MCWATKVTMLQKATVIVCHASEQNQLKFDRSSPTLQADQKTPMLPVKTYIYIYEETYEKGDLKFAVEHRVHVSNGYMLDFRAWGWCPQNGIPPYGGEALDTTDSAGFFSYTLSCQIIDTPHKEQMRAFHPDFSGEREDAEQLITQCVMLEAEGTISNEDPGKCTMNRIWSNTFVAWSRPATQGEKR